MKIEQKIKIACDNHVGLNVIKVIQESGYEVVFRAWDESDWEWLNKAKSLGANLFISCDWDVEFFCNKNNFCCIRLPQGKGGKTQMEFILKALRRFHGT